jgi:hypothetical protein
VAKSTLKSHNKTLNDVTNNDPILEKGLQDIKNFVNEENGEIKRKYKYTLTLVTLNDHAIQLQRALEEVKDEYDIIINSCVNAKSGIIKPQVLSPSHMIEILKSSQESFPHDLQVPVPLSEAYAYLLINILSVDAYIVRSSLVYIVRYHLSHTMCMMCIGFCPSLSRLMILFFFLLLLVGWCCAHFIRY